MTLPCGCNPMPCGCCEGTEVLTPLETANRPGLSALAYRVGTHATFLETMKARLSSLDFQELRGLTSREPNDPAIALLDGWAAIADVLTFYQERIANEGYLRTATERRSVLELARLVGYKLRPGVASSVYLAYTLENNYKVEIPIGARAQSLPGPGELPQSFETAEVLESRAEWNNLQPRMTRPQNITLSNGGSSIDADTIYFEGTALNLKPNDPLLFVFEEEKGALLLRHVKSAEVQAAEQRTKTTLQEAPAALTSPVGIPPPPKSALDVLGKVLDPLSTPPSRQPPNSLRLQRDFKQTFDTQRDLGPQLLATFRPSLGPILYQALEGAFVTKPASLNVFVLRAKAALFGHNLPVNPPQPQISIANARTGHPLYLLALDAEYHEIIKGKGSWVRVVRPGSAQPFFSTVENVQTVTMGGEPTGDLS